MAKVTPLSPATDNKESEADLTDTATADTAVAQEETEVKVKGIYATEYFRKTKIPYCEKCGEQYHTDTNNNPVCPENFSVNDCPRLGI